MAVDIVQKVVVGETQHCLEDAARFDGLVLALKKALGPSSGLKSEDVDVGYLTRLMEEYDAREEGWLPYKFGDASRGYTRNLVDEGNGKSNLLVLVWSPGKGSPIHDHGNAHCLMKILRGSLTETRYDFPDADKEEPMRVISERTYKENAVTYMADELGVHKVWNQGSDFAVSLHCRQTKPIIARLNPPHELTMSDPVYTPPNVAKGGCNIFVEQTGKSAHISKCGNYSEYGRLLKD